MRAGLVQLCSGDDPAANLAPTLDLIREAAGKGARWVLTPECTNCVSADRARQRAVLRREDDDPTLAALAEEARDLGIWLLIGSLTLLAGDDGDVPFVNRSFLIGPDGGIRARYDKIHMFDVQVSETETYRESAAYRPGGRAVLADLGGVPVGLSICYDLRFPELYQRLARAGAAVLTVPSAFSPGTGPAHWRPLLQARAIETGCFVLAPAQCGTHAATSGRVRRTHGHSLAVSPWGELLADGGDLPGVQVVEIDLSDVETSRMRIPAIRSARTFEGP